MEKGGRNVRQILQKSDVGCSGKCGREECMICSTQAGGGNCFKEGVGYKIWCMQCDEDGHPAVMHGETGRSARKRVGEHYEALSKRKDSKLWEHCCEVHDGEMMSFGCEVTRSFKEDPLSRQLDEALRIQREEGVLMNDKNEWTRPAGFNVFASRM